MNPLQAPEFVDAAKKQVNADLKQFIGLVIAIEVGGCFLPFSGMISSFQYLTLANSTVSVTFSETSFWRDLC